MAKKVGFFGQGDARADSKDIPEVGIGMIGYAFMGKAHCNAYKKIPYIYWPPTAKPRLIAICGRNEAKVKEAKERYGFEKYYTDWREMLKDPDIQVIDNTAPNNAHKEACIAAAEAGKHILCEKPLARDATDAKQMLEAVKKAGVKHACAFNTRFVPAVRLAKNFIDEGRLGTIYHVRARFLQEWLVNPDLPHNWRLSKEVAGSGTLGDLAAHSIDVCRHLVGEPKCVSAMQTTFIKERPSADDPSKKVPVDIDDATEVIWEFQNGAVGTLESSRFCLGRKNDNSFEINGSKGSIAFNLEDLNRIQVYLPDDEMPEVAGWHNVLVSEAFHPYWEVWWPHGHIIGWEHSFIHELNHFLGAVATGKDVGPDAATFEDGYRNNVICDAIVKAAETGGRVTINY
ncbi:MAG TPA: Gfo/Idh/MocA family oxidoreductase [Armatimonadota bacterium]|jgi:predicted dehydrogenase